MSVGGTQYLAHHLAWYYTHGQWLDEIDHKDGHRSHNWIDNLRPAQRFENNGNSDGWAQNKRTHKLPRGVYHHTAKGCPYRAQIVINYKQIHLGCFSTIKDAEAAYKAAAKQHFGAFAK